MSRRLATVVAVFAGVAVCASPGEARFIENWPYDKLMKESDLVVFAKAVKTEVTADEPPKHSWPYDFVGQNTTFEAKHALKGKVDGKQIKVLHFNWGELKKGLDPKDPFSHLIRNGPLLVAFETKDAPEHLLFLKSLKDGRFEPVSGRIDPRLSVRKLSFPPEELEAEK